MADKRPTCKLCKHPHWTREPHIWKDSAVTESVTPVTESVTFVTPSVTPFLGDTLSVTPVTVAVTDTICPTCGQYVRRKYPSHAARQKAYRDRN